MTRSSAAETAQAAGREAARAHASDAGRAQELEARLAQSRREIDELRATLDRVESSTIWQAVGVLRRRVYGRIGEDSRVARALRAALRAAAGIASREQAAAQAVDRPPIAELPQFAAPEVSLILPVHSQPELTTACVRAIVAGATVPYELIIVDDTATPATRDVVARIVGASVIVNGENLGYTRSLNRGAAVARAPFLLFLNDDTVPEPGWLEAMVDCALSSEGCGVVVPMYLDTDGRVKEAGSIVWRDGSAENFGRGDECTTRSRYQYRRDVDYGSGAGLLVSARVFRDVGGLDERFSPAYYEDVDLCFAAREAGARVVYEPRARVVHVEGATAGTDVSAGTKRFQVVNQRPFAEKWRHRLGEQPQRGLDPRLASDRSAGPRVLIADVSVPTPDRDGGSRRMWRLIGAFRDLGCQVTLLPAGGAATEPYAGRLESEGVEVLRRADELERELSAVGPALDLAVLSRPHVASRYVYMLRELAPSARIAYDAVDLHYLRELRRSQLEARPAGPRVDALRELELAMVRCCDVTVVVSEEERAELLAAVPEADVAVISTIQEVVDDRPSLEQRDGIAFVGSFLHPPNVDAARFLLEQVMPRVWERSPDAHVKIVGQQPPPDLAALAGPRVDVTGWVGDLASVLGQTRVAVAPMRYGAGLKLKTVEAMAHGVPVVATTLGAEGLAATHGNELLVADDPSEFAAGTVALLTDDGLWRRLSDRGRELVHDRFAPAVITPQLEALLDRQPSRYA